MNPSAMAAIQTSQPLRTRAVIMADSSSALPTRIEILKAGTWPASSVKGPLTITMSDLKEFKRNFDAGVGIPAGLGKIPIDFSHEEWKQAAGWITALSVEGESLMADVEWSTSGASALEGGEYKCISPSFWPACCGEWNDPEDSEMTARNVLSGAGLTNIPFFKALTPIMASNASKDGKKINNTIWITADEKEQSMNIDELRIKDASALSAEEKTFLADHKSELGADELTKFGLADAPAPVEPVVAPVPDEDETNNEEPEVTQEVKEAVAVNASIKSGEKVLIEASAFKDMQGKVEAAAKQLADYRQKEVEASVDKHIAVGRIVADSKAKWVTRILADATLQEDLEALPANPVLASELGGDGGDSNHAISEQFAQKVQEAITASNGTLAYGDAVKQVASANPQLANDRNTELTSRK
jgi:hypothetical protein